MIPSKAFGALLGEVLEGGDANLAVEPFDNFVHVVPAGVS